MFHVCIAHCMPEKIHKMSKCDNFCLFVWSTVHTFLDKTPLLSRQIHGTRGKYTYAASLEDLASTQTANT